MTYQLAHRTDRELSPGKFYPRGATPKKNGVNFAVFSRYATEIFLLLFDDPEGEPTDIIKLEDRTRFVWHVFVHGLKPGQLYAFKVRGRYDAHHGMRFNERKLLISPYAKAITAPIRDRDGLMFGYDMGSQYGDLVPDERDNTSVMPKSIVIDDAFDWNGDEPPDIPLEELVIYEVHVKGFTAHPSSGVRHPGTYLGVIEKIPYLKDLGINAVEFLPVQQFYVEDFLLNNGLTNYWGYNTICFFAPEVTYGTGSYPGCQVHEFKTMVKELHKAGIEVILDVVYNHTAEGNERGPTLSFKGIDNGSYYHLTGPESDPWRYYMNYTGCGNSLRVAEPNVLWLVMDSLRYWVQEMHVDGFRFDLASVLGRGPDGHFEHSASFFDAVTQDPVLSRVKLIAEPWDLQTNQGGNFPVSWSEWNGRFRDAVRMFGKGDPGQAAEMGWRLTGSADLFGNDGRIPANSINFITCHDGFTLYDLVSYNGKHNEANQEMNNDGTNDNYSWNCGWEGETDNEEINRLRRRQVKNFLCYLFFSTGTPMLLGGDEFMRTQRGNNNTYCQDNELTWFDWSLVEQNRDMVDFTKHLIRFTKKHGIRLRRKFFQGCRSTGEGTVCDISWYGKDLGQPVWHDPCFRTICFLFHEGEAPLFFILNADPFPQEVALPSLDSPQTWRRVIDTSRMDGDDFVAGGVELPAAQQTLKVEARSTVVLKAE